jgi:all-trans-retinol dehydrogenase (NAD+)
MKSVKLKRVLVTGGARGLGLALGRAFAERGSEVVLTDLDEEGLAEAREVLSAAGRLCRSYSLDVTDLEAISELRARLHREAGKIDFLVNNAGVVFGGPFLEVPLEHHLKTYQVNVQGVVAMSHAFLPDLIDSPSGHLVNIASASGFIGLPNGSTYASSKWAVIGFSESIRQELKRGGHRYVGVTTVCPSYVDTGMFEGVKAPLLTRFLNPEELAEKVLDAVEHNRAFVLEPWLVKLTPLLAGALPTGLGDLLADTLGASASMERWQGHGPT